MTAPQYFDYVSVAQEAGIRDDQLRQIERIFREDYPTDDMLFELHVLRLCHSVKAGRTNLEAVLRNAGPGKATAA